MTRTKTPLGNVAAEPRPEPEQPLNDCELRRIKQAESHGRDAALAQIMHERTASEQERSFRAQIKAEKIDEMLHRMDSLEQRKGHAEAERTALIKKTVLAGSNRITRDLWQAIAGLDAEILHHDERLGVLQAAVANLKGN